MTRTALVGSLLIIVSVLFLGNAWQAFRFARLEMDVLSIRRQHLAVLEENKRLIVGVAGLRSPRRIRSIAQEELGLAPLAADRVKRVDFAGGAGGD